jgi:hypothetical protein
LDIGLEKNNANKNILILGFGMKSEKGMDIHHSLGPLLLEAKNEHFVHLIHIMTSNHGCFRWCRFTHDPMV